MLKRSRQHPITLALLTGLFVVLSSGSQLNRAVALTNKFPETSLVPIKVKKPIEAKPASRPLLTPDQQIARKAALNRLRQAIYKDGRKPQSAVQIVTAVIPFLKHPDPEVRIAASQTLQKLGPFASSAVPYLMPLLQDPDLSVRNWVPYALAESGYAAKAATPQLKRILRNSNDIDSTVAAYWALSYVDRDTRQARLQSLLQEMQAADPKVRDRATFAMHFMKPIESIPQLTQLLNDRRPDVRKNTADIINTANVAATMTEANIIQQNF
jgi:HEAT repeat protein